MFIFIYGIIFTPSEVELWKSGPTTPLGMLNQRVLPGISEDFLVIRLHIACDRHNLPYVPASDKMALACSFGRLQYASAVDWPSLFVTSSSEYLRPIFIEIPPKSTLTPAVGLTGGNETLLC